ncbi:MAG: winged helix-turn-helix domain-containing protein [Candidatus Saccharibacteria bacterium]|nr:winged helix-turn-helix domain-containing protein [Candidatus Saccharibacteria bacterium]
MQSTSIHNPQLTNSEERLIYIMQLLGDKTRYKLFKLLMSRQEMCVSEIADELDISPSAVSQHFRNFEIVGLVDKQRFGQRICYVLKNQDDLVHKIEQIAVEESK